MVLKVLITDSMTSPHSTLRVLLGLVRARTVAQVGDFSDKIKQPKLPAVFRSINC